MKNTSLVLLAISLTAPFSHADIKNFLFARKQAAQARTFTLDIVDSSKAKEGTFTQKTDHFNKDARTFKQRYFVDSTDARGENAPVIYYLCGEGTCEGASDSTLVNKIADKYGAHKVALEHRYYGYSQPFATLETENLKYLSMDQAIEDLAEFQKFAQATMGLNGKWISVGGSYAGELSAFYRLKHPELVVGALASSAPVLAKAAFWEYDTYVAKVAGPKCLAAIQSVVADVEGKLKNRTSAEKVKALFDSSEVKNHVDFLYILADMAAIAIQYGYQTKFCNAITQGLANGNATEAYAEVGLKLFSDFGMTPLQDSFQGAESTNPEDYVGWVGARAWFYQSCTEFGYYQIAAADATNASRSQQLTLDYHNSVCKRLFNIDTQVDTERTNRVYYKNLFDKTTTGIFFTNGQNDPWSNLSIIESNPDSSLNPALPFFTIPGAAHCDDLGRRVSDGLTKAREQFTSLVGEWLGSTASN